LESEDKRYIKLEMDEPIVGFCEINGWVFGFKERDAKCFGFCPVSYLKEIKKITE
jgi:hypothetical protein